MAGWSDPFDLRRAHGTARFALMMFMVVGSIAAVTAGAILLSRSRDNSGWQFRQKSKDFESSGERAALQKGAFKVKTVWSSAYYHWAYDPKNNEFGSQQASSPRLMPSVDLRVAPTSLPEPTCLSIYGDGQKLLNLPMCPEGDGKGIPVLSWRESVTLRADGEPCDAMCCVNEGGRWDATGCHRYQIVDRVCVKALKTIAGWSYQGSCQADGSHVNWIPANFGVPHRVMPAIEIRSPSDPMLAYAPYDMSASDPQRSKSYMGQSWQWWLGLGLVLAGSLALVALVSAMALRVRRWREADKLLLESMPRSDATDIRHATVVA